MQELTQQATSSSDSAHILELETERKLAEERIAELEGQLHAVFGDASKFNLHTGPLCLTGTSSKCRCAAAKAQCAFISMRSFRDFVDL